MLAGCGSQTDDTGIADVDAGATAGDGSPPIFDGSVPDAGISDSRGPTGPTDIQLSNETVNERAPTGTLVGRLSVMDPDPDDVHYFELIADAGGRFVLAGDELQVAGYLLLDYESARSYDIIIRVIEFDGLTLDKTLTIQVTDQTEICSMADSGAGSLRQAIENSTDETIYVDACGTINLASPLFIKRNLSIRGPGSGALAISSGNLTQVLLVAQGTAATIEDLTLSKGTSSGSGGCIESHGHLNLRRVTLRDCTARKHGGAVVSSHGQTIVVESCTFAGNRAFRLGGAIAGSNIRISRARFHGNVSEQSGGAIAAVPPETLELPLDKIIGQSGAKSTTSFEEGCGNPISARQAVFDHRDGGQEAVRPKKIGRCGQSRWRVDGARPNTSGAVISPGALSATPIETLTIADTVLLSNTAKHQGGAIHVAQGLTATIQNTTLWNNRAGRGGAMAGRGSATLRHVTIAGNMAENEGGGIFQEDAGLILEHTIVAGNRAATGGPDIEINDSPLATAAIVSNGYNLVQSPVGHSLAHGSGGDRIGQDPLLGGVIDNGGSTETVALALTSPAVDAIPAEHCTLPMDQRGQLRPLSGGCDIGAYEAAPQGIAAAAPVDIAISHTTISERAPNGMLAGILRAVDANPGDTHTYEIIGTEGPFALVGAELRVVDAIQLRSTPEHPVNLRVTDNTGRSFEKTLTIRVLNEIEVCSTADSGPGSLRQAIADAPNGSTIYIDACGVIPLASSITIVDKEITLQGPGAERLTISGGKNTRLFEFAGTSDRLSLVDLTLADGSTSEAGGCIASEGALTLVRLIMRGCTAQSAGGAVFVTEPFPYSLSRAPLEVIDSVFVDNISLLSGGAIFSGVVNELEGNFFHKNHARSKGGALDVFEDTSIVNSTFAGNTAKEFGGGALNSRKKSIIENTTISGNRGRRGGGIAGFQSLFLHHVTVARNEADLDGGGIIHHSSSGTGLILEHTIIAGNRNHLSVPDDLNYQIKGSGISLISFGYNLIGSGHGHDLVDGQNGDRVGVDALLEPLADNGGPTATHAVMPGSPAIDAIPPLQCRLPIDQRGQFRPAGAGCDMGAYEQADQGHQEIRTKTLKPK